jgi:hypothetical protein
MSKFETPRDHICPKGRMQTIALNLSSFWRCRTDEREPESGYFTVFRKAPADNIDCHFMLFRAVKVNRKTYRELPVRRKTIYACEAASVPSHTDSTLFGRRERGKEFMFLSESEFSKGAGARIQKCIARWPGFRREEPAHHFAHRCFGDADRGREDEDQGM